MHKSYNEDSHHVRERNASMSNNYNNLRCRRQVGPDRSIVSNIINNSETNTILSSLKNNQRNDEKQYNNCVAGARDHFQTGSLSMSQTHSQRSIRGRGASSGSRESTLYTTYETNTARCSINNTETNHKTHSDATDKGTQYYSQVGPLTRSENYSQRSIRRQGASRSSRESSRNTTYENETSNVGSNINIRTNHQKHLDATEEGHRVGDESIQVKKNHSTLISIEDLYKAQMSPKIDPTLGHRKKNEHVIRRNFSEKAFCSGNNADQENSLPAQYDDVMKSDQSITERQLGLNVLRNPKSNEYRALDTVHPKKLNRRPLTPSGLASSGGSMQGSRLHRSEVKTRSYNGSPEGKHVLQNIKKRTQPLVGSREFSDKRSDIFSQTKRITQQGTSSGISEPLGRREDIAEQSKLTDMSYDHHQDPNESVDAVETSKTETNSDEINSATEEDCFIDVECKSLKEESHSMHTPPRVSIDQETKALYFTNQMDVMKAEAAEYVQIIEMYRFNRDTRLYEYIQESLIRIQLRLDKLEVDQSAILRSCRKEVIQYINGLLRKLDMYSGQDSI